MLKAESMNKQPKETPVGGEPELREKIVGRQREIEEQLARDAKGRAVFFVNFPLTPMYINPKAVEKDPKSNLYKLKKGYEHAIPKGLIPDDKLKDPVQLSTVLGRVLSLWELKLNPVVIFYVKDRIVDSTQFSFFKENHLNFDLQPIDEEIDYKPFIGKISEATYAYAKDNQPIEQCTFSTQIIDPNRPSTWQILEGQETLVPITYLNDLLVKYGKEPITQLEAKTNDERMATSIPILPGISLFTHQQIGGAANTSLPTTETCRSSFPSPK